MVDLRSAPQFIIPTPMGRTVLRDEGMGEEERREEAVERWVERVEMSVPAAMKPMPPALETSTANGAREINLIGA